MKLHTTRSEVLLENYIKTQIKNLIMEVYKTSASGLNKGKYKVSTSAELWNIQWNKKDITNRKAFFKVPF